MEFLEGNKLKRVKDSKLDYFSIKLRRKSILQFYYYLGLAAQITHFYY